MTVSTASHQVTSQAPPTAARTVPPRQPMACGGDLGLHVYLVDLDRPCSAMAELARLLCPDERSRGARFRDPLHQRRFVVGRAVLRVELAQRLGVPPAAVPIAYGPAGKPIVTNASPPLHFSVSHCDNVALLAFAPTRVGIDIERIRAVAHLKRLAHHCLSVEEHAAYVAARPDGRAAMLLRLWTRKEAYLKATGSGIDGPLRDINVRLTSRPQRPQDERNGSPSWSVHDLHVPAHVAAVAIDAAADRPGHDDG